MNRGLLLLLVVREWQHHPWRHAVALLAVALGVALAYSVHLINQSALGEFAAALRSASGDPDLSLRGPRDGFDDTLFDRVAADPAVRVASPVLEIDTYAVAPGAAASAATRIALRVLGIDALRAGPLAPALLPRAAPGEPRLVFLDPGAAFPNASASARLQLQPGATLQLQSGPRVFSLRVAGSAPVAGPPLMLMDLAGAQQQFGAIGRLTRIDLRLRPGADRDALLRRLALPAGVAAVAADEAGANASALSRAYRVNLTVLALVALFVGGFLVFSVVALSVAQRAQALALLGVLGMTAAQRQRWVLIETAVVGISGSVVGLGAGAALAAVALRFLGGDLGGGYFPGLAPTLQLDWAGAALFGALGLASAIAAGWWPARQAQRIAPAQALKGLGGNDAAPSRAWPGAALIAAGGVAALAPPIGGLPLAAYAAVAALLLGGVVLVPAVVHGLLAIAPQPRAALPLLALQRARFQRRGASAAVAGVVASLALSTALTVMVTSFRSGVGAWLDRVLPADLYVRSAGSSRAAGQAWLAPDFAERVAAVPGVLRVQATRMRALDWAPGQPTVTLIARPLGQPDADLPLLAPALPLPAGETGVFVSEAMVSLYGASVGSRIELPLGTQRIPVRVRGVWRDYARQFGAVVIAAADYRALTGDTRINDLSLWLAPGADPAAVQARVEALLPVAGLLEFASAAELRRLSLQIFDRSFAVTYYLQAVAIAIGLVGIAASLSAQVLARRKEFGLLAHLGLTRRQIVALVAGESLAWIAAGTLVGLLLGIAISIVLVHVVNPQSFHWTMDLVLPWGRLALLAASVLLAGTVTAAYSARRAAGRAAVLSVKEDW